LRNEFTEARLRLLPAIAGFNVSYKMRMARSV
jgi:hypothetical protein